jgi:AraC-like DNA-binding protein
MADGRKENQDGAMTSTVDSFAPLRFSTDDLPERDRMAICREVFGRHVAKLQLEGIPGTRFSQTVTLRSLPGLSLMFGNSSGLRAERSRMLMHDGNDDLVFNVATEGVSHISQIGREATIAPCEGVLLSNAEAGALTYPVGARYIAITVPRNTIAAMVNDPEAATVRPVPKQTEALRLLVSYVTAADDSYAFATPELRRAFATHVQDLVALVIGATREGTDRAGRGGARAARLLAIKTDIRAGMGQANLSLEAIARHQGISPRYVRKLFDLEGTTFTEFVLDQRLARAHRMLIDRQFSHRTIGAIAFTVGFGDLSYFNRAFRRRYGATPSDVRAAAQREWE